MGGSLSSIYYPTCWARQAAKVHSLGLSRNNLATLMGKKVKNRERALPPVNRQFPNLSGSYLMVHTFNSCECSIARLCITSVSI